MASRVITVNKTKSMPKQVHWSPAQKELAVAKWLILGNIMEVQRQTGIPEITLRKWKAQDWWTDKEKELRKQANTELEGKLGRVLDKSLEQTLDRLENGDIFYNQKNGKFERVPVKAVVANQINRTMLDKKFLLEQINNKTESKEEAIMDRLEAIKKEFFSMARKKLEPMTIIDVTPIQETDNAIQPQLQNL